MRLLINYFYATVTTRQLDTRPAQSVDSPATSDNRYVVTGKF